MEQLVMSIAIPLAKQYGMDKALEIAYEKLGIAAPDPENTAIDVLTGGGINQSFSPNNLTNMLKKQGVKFGFNTLMKGAGSSLLPFAGIAGLAMLGNKYRKQLTGYDTQSAYEAARDQRIADKRLNYITDRMIAGKKTANYKDALLNSSAGAVEIDDVIYSGADYFPEPSKPKETYTPSYNIAQVSGGSNDNVSSSPSKSSPSKSSPSKSSGTSSARGSNFGSRFHGARGGIVSL
tara:strand:- start:39 stop:743 length:705 start_codon:yes stop_codon:yes gene_type:complete